MPSRKSASMLSKAEIKDIRSLHDAKGRSSQQRFIAEGIKLTGEMLGAFPCELLLADEETARGIARQLDKLPQALRPKRIEVVPKSFDWGRVSSQRQPQPLLGVFALPQEDEGSPITSGVSLLLDRIQDPGNMLATIVAFNEATDAQVARDVAMQIAAMAPVGITEEDVPADVKERELNLAREKAREAGKPENLVDHIAQGALKKYYKENTLLDQLFVKDNKLTIAQYLQAQSKSLTVTAFKRVTLKAE